MRKALLISKNMNKAFPKLYSAAKQYTSEISTLIMANENEKIETGCNIRVNYSQIGLSQPHIASIPLIDIIKPYSAIFSTNDPFHKELLSCIASKLGVTPIHDIISSDGNKLKRSIYAGRIISTIESYSNPLIGTFKSSDFTSLEGPGINPLNISTINYKSVIEDQYKFIGKSVSNADNDIERAKIILCGGRGLLNKENFANLFTLAHKIGPHCAVGGTRVAVDSGLIGNSFQIGQTGKSVSSDVYIGFGVSGALQHLAGIKNCKKIIAINTDAEANLIKYSDCYILDDAATVLKALLLQY